MKLAPNQIAALALGCLGLVAIGRWWWQPRAAAAEAREVSELDAVRGRMAIALDAEPLADESPHALRWQLSGSCTQVYAFTIDESFADESVAVFLARAEEHSRWLLAIGPHPQLEGRLAALLVPDDPSEPEQPRLRELFSSPESRELGPAAPDFACRNRTWDPIEDALALGWPELPDAPVRAGTRWHGQVVGGRCHETTCLDGAGQFDHARSCQARPWTEQLVGWLRPAAGGPAMAVLRSSWDDGHEDETSEAGEFGILTSRELTIAEGRPVLAQAEIWHRWTGVVRRLELRALDECAPGAADLAETIARVRASLPAPG
jgi:hypothetical protein